MHGPGPSPSQQPGVLPRQPGVLPRQPGVLPRHPGGLSRARVLAGFVAVIAGLPVVTGVLVSLRGDLARESVLLVYMLLVVVVAVIGGVLPALLAAAGAFLLANYFLTPPYNTFAIRDRSALVDLVVFLLAALVVSVAVEIGARRRATAERDRMEAQLVSRFGSAEMTEAPVSRVLDQVRALFSMTTVALTSGGGHVARVGPEPHDPPTLRVEAGAGLTLTAYGPALFAEDQRLLAVLAQSASRAWEREQLTTEAARARQLAETDQVRSALLAAVSHDLRTPIAGIKTAASGLRQTGVEWGPGEEDELLASIESGADRLAALVDNLLAMSRIQAGALSVHPTLVAMDEVVARALLSIGAHDVAVNVPEDLPPAWADPGLLERVVANLVDNARRWSPPDEPLEIVATAGTEDLRLDVVDHGPGVDPTRWSDMFTPFQRLGDTSSDGVGLGLAIVRGMLDTMGGQVTPATTPGGGLTMSVKLRTAP